MSLQLCDFGKIKIYQPTTGYRFSYEPFILSKVENKNFKKAIDFGSGCGIIAILLSITTNIKEIYAIENDPFYKELIIKNAKANGVNNIILCSNLNDIPNNSIDLVITNPPYFTKAHFRISKRFKTQKFESIPINLIIAQIANKVKNGCLFRLSFHPTRLIELFHVLSTNKFGIKTLQLAYGKKNGECQSCIVEAKFLSKNYLRILQPIFLEDYKLF